MKELNIAKKIMQLEKDSHMEQLNSLLKAFTVKIKESEPQLLISIFKTLASIKIAAAKKHTDINESVN